MRNPVYNCIKNVYNLGKQQVKTGGHSSTNKYTRPTIHQKPGHIHTIIHKVSAAFHPLYTQPIYLKLPLKSTQFYTVYTTPITTKAKENKKGISQ